MSHQCHKYNGRDYDVCLGTIVGFHGLKGELRVKLSFDNPSLLLEAKSALFVKDGLDSQLCQITKARLAKGNAFLTLKEYSSRTAAESLVAGDLYVAKNALPELDENEWWASDLIGLPVFTTAGKAVGTIADVVGNHGQLLAIAKTGSLDKEPTLVPFVSELVPVVDLINRRIEVKALPGLLDD